MNKQYNSLQVTQDLKEKIEEKEEPKEEVKETVRVIETNQDYLPTA